MSDHNPASGKQLLRQTLRLELSTMTEAQRRLESQAMVSEVRRLWRPKPGQWLLATLPMEDEPDLRDWYHDWLEAGATVALARTGSQKSLSFHQILDLNGPWETRGNGLKEPLASTVDWRPGPTTLCLVPGLGFRFDPQGGVWRLGRGGGYYDRWLALNSPWVVSWGTGFRCQLTNSLPVDSHDEPLDGLVCPEEWRVNFPKRPEPA